MFKDYTLVCGVDRKHFRQLVWVWSTWKLHKPSLLKCPMIVFYDRAEVNPEEVIRYIDHPNLLVVPWPPTGAEYKGGEGKWNNLQRNKMLSGFVHIPARFVRTNYWLKIDTDTVAKGVDDWIDPSWFEGDPAIVSHPWSFTKPPNQMLELDKWVAANCNAIPGIASWPPLDLKPKNPEATRLGHKRIISWCGFFKTSFSFMCSAMARNTMGEGVLPVPSQDGYMWYCARRMECEIKRTNMKSRGWEHWSSEVNIRRRVEEILNESC